MFIVRRRGFKSYEGYGAVYDENAAWKKAYEVQYGSPTMRGLIVGGAAAAGSTLTSLFISYFFQPKKKKAFKIYSVVTTIASAGIGFWAGRKTARNNMETAYIIDNLSQQLADTEAVALEQELPEETTVEVIEG